MASVENTISRLKEAKIDYSRAAEKDMYALTVLVTKNIFVTNQEMQYYYNFVLSNNKYSEYLKNISYMHRGSIKCTLDTEIHNELYTRSNIAEEEIYSKLAKAISLLYVDRLLSSFSSVNILLITNRKLRDSKIPLITNILADEDMGLDIPKLSSTLIILVKYFYKQITFEYTTDTLADSYKSLLKLKRKNIKSFINKSCLLDATDTDEYKATVTVEFLVPILLIASKIKDLVLDLGQIKLLLVVADKYGYDSTEVDKYINKIRHTYDRRKLIEIRKKYTYITRLDMSDEELLSKSNVELAGINYELKLKADEKINGSTKLY